MPADPTPIEDLDRRILDPCAHNGVPEAGYAPAGGLSSVAENSTRR